MKIVVREGVFETNSSSTHSFTMSSTHPDKYTFECKSPWSRLTLLRALINHSKLVKRLHDDEEDQNETDSLDEDLDTETIDIPDEKDLRKIAEDEGLQYDSDKETLYDLYIEKRKAKKKAEKERERERITSILPKINEFLKQLEEEMNGNEFRDISQYETYGSNESQESSPVENDKTAATDKTDADVDYYEDFDEFDYYDYEANIRKPYNIDELIAFESACEKVLCEKEKIAPEKLKEFLAEKACETFRINPRVSQYKRYFLDYYDCEGDDLCECLFENGCLSTCDCPYRYPWLIKDDIIGVYNSAEEFMAKAEKYLYSDSSIFAIERYSGCFTINSKKTY